MNRVTFIVPTYNCEDYVEEVVNSITGQMNTDDELILVDDGSSDRTREKLEQYRDCESITLIYDEHKGPSAARNTGLNNAQGEYVTFVDCDDLLKSGFVEKVEDLLYQKADLYIFGIERIPLEGNREYWKVKDKKYEDVSEFADDYIINGHLLVYSNCNKFYKRGIIEKLALRFSEEMDFGEDRVFNYEYLKGCGSIITSKQIMLSYVQRNLSSLSSRYIANYFEKAKKLHEMKIRTFLSLAKNVSDEDKCKFASRDVRREIEIELDRFETNPKEEEENLPAVNEMIFDDTDDMEDKVDIIIVLGSYNCGYRVEKALEMAKKNPNAYIIVTGGNLNKGGKKEAVFMHDYLLENGIDNSRIYTEEKAKSTFENLDLSQVIIEEIREEHKGEGKFNRVAIVSGSFHMGRVKTLVKRLPSMESNQISYVTCFGENTMKHNWYKNAVGRNVVLAEFTKRLEARNYGVE